MFDNDALAMQLAVIIIAEALKGALGDLLPRARRDRGDTTRLRLMQKQDALSGIRSARFTASLDVGFLGTFCTSRHAVSSFNFYMRCTLTSTKFLLARCSQGFISIASITLNVWVAGTCPGGMEAWLLCNRSMYGQIQACSVDPPCMIPNDWWLTMCGRCRHDSRDVSDVST